MQKIDSSGLGIDDFETRRIMLHVAINRLPDVNYAILQVFIWVGFSS